MLIFIRIASHLIQQNQGRVRNKNSIEIVVIKSNSLFYSFLPNFTNFHKPNEISLYLLKG